MAEPVRSLWRSCLAPQSSSPPSLTDLQDLVHRLRGCLSGDTTSGTTFLSNPITLCAIAVTYLLTLLLTGQYMRVRDAKFPQSAGFSRIAAAHNIILSVWSLGMNLHVSYGLFQSVRHSPHRLSSAICVRASSSSSTIPAIIQHAMYIFLVSKIYELIDTLILVLRKRPLSLLHVWHHTSVMFEVWAWIHYDFVLGSIGMWFNTFVHVFMYLYYALALIGVKFRAKWIITMTQIVQFVTCFVFAFPLFYLHRTIDGGCKGINAAFISMFINGSYLILFILFYRKTYLSPKKSKDLAKRKKAS